MFNPGLRRRARRALDRQLEYQRRKSLNIRGREQEVIDRMIRRSRAVREKLEQVQPIPADARVLEVGSGAHGLIFYFEAAERVGVDPLADHYAKLFPAWQGRVPTIAAGGEQLPFAASSFDIVLCDNVVDHATSPRRIVAEIARVLAPGGLLYFTVNVHHPIYHLAASAHAAWRAAGIPVEITPFADHTVHLTLAAARRLFDGTPLRIVRERDTIDEVKNAVASKPVRHMGDRLKWLFFKNALYEVIAMRDTA
jgi:SAM-dependent methyltransferase